ncbi:SDR family oxidoreductase [Parasphingopyxis algicola]|uniref:SDR family NAD(P)-dependent oxidoreductase n=1 Tax=Parasphingopyxis algicola TaxID=2026624 RepID=UPI0015A47368|nr:SDR family oxidoreductase [Parasphingopyxis algicola]QLC25372.1 SDR family oxidoreductase [Parasphingopyxis algicola]
MDLGLKGARALVTGGSRGIGAAICRALAGEGAAIATCARGEDGLNAVLDGYRALGVEAHGEAFDVREPEALEGWVARSAEKLGGIDIVVSNVSTRIDPASADWWPDTFETDLMQHVRLKTLAVPHLERGNDAAMVFIASIASVMTTLPPHEEAYGAMKAGLVNLVGQWAVMLAPKAIRVNAISPGPVDFEGGWWDQVKKAQPEMYQRAAGLAALGRLGAPEEIADAAAFLASPKSSFTTGANLRIDGGLVKTPNF